MFLLYSRFLVDKDSFSKLDSRLQQILYIFACTNSVADPFVYGFFNLRLANSTESSQHPRVWSWINMSTSQLHAGSPRAI